MAQPSVLEQLGSLFASELKSGACYNPLCRELRLQEYGLRVRITSANDGVRKHRVSFTCWAGLTSVGSAFS